MEPSSTRKESHKRKIEELVPVQETKRVKNNPSKLLLLQGHDIPFTWADHLTEDEIMKIFKYEPFIDWMESINRIQNHDLSKPELIVDKIHIQQIDMFGPRIGFIKFEVAARKWNEKMQQIASVPGIVFMRGGAVAILCILIEAETGKEYALITLQPRIPVGFPDFPEIPAGMLDGESDNLKFAGKAAKEMNEETLLEIKGSELYDLTQLAYTTKYKGTDTTKYKGMYPSAGGCDEFLKLFLYRRYMSKETMQLLRLAHAGECASEIIKLKIVPLDDLWKEAPDAKALSALYLYTKFQELKIQHPPTALNLEQEDRLKAILNPKIAHNQELGQKLQLQDDYADYKGHEGHEDNADNADNEDKEDKGDSEDNEENEDDEDDEDHQQLDSSREGNERERLKRLDIEDNEEMNENEDSDDFDDDDDDEDNEENEENEQNDEIDENDENEGNERNQENEENEDDEDSEDNEDHENKDERRDEEGEEGEEGEDKDKNSPSSAVHAPTLANHVNHANHATHANHTNHATHATATATATTTCEIRKVR